MSANTRNDNDCSAECRFCVGDNVEAIFMKYGEHKFIGVITGIHTNIKSLNGVWISVLPMKEEENDEISKLLVSNKIEVMVPLKNIRKPLS